MSSPDLYDSGQLKSLQCSVNHLAVRNLGISQNVGSELHFHGMLHVSVCLEDKQESVRRVSNIFPYPREGDRPFEKPTGTTELLSKVVYGLIMRRRDPAFSIYEFDAANDLGEMVRSIEFSPFSLSALA